MGESTEVDRTGNRPSRGYSWEPFHPGHTLSTRHGAFSPRRVEPRAAELVEMVLGDPGTAYLQASRWRAAVWAWARAETRVELLETWLTDQVGGAGLTEDGDISPALRALGKWESIALHHRSRLGLDPLSAARLGRDTAAAGVDLAKLLSEVADDGKSPAVAAVERLTGLSPQQRPAQGVDASAGLSGPSTEELPDEQG